MPSPATGRCIVAPLAVTLATLALSFGGAKPAVAAETAPARHAYDLSADGAWAVAGASAHEGHRGAAYVYRRNGTSWVMDATLAPTERGPFARFGGAVAIEGNLLVVGAPWDDGWQGAAYLYERDGRTWKQVARIAPEAAVGDRFGARVAIEGGVVSVGAEGGAVVRFTRSGSQWTESARGGANAFDFTPGTAPDARLLQAVAAEDARHGAQAPLAPEVIDPPAVVRASDGTYEDRTEIRWTAVDAGTFLYKIYRRLASDPPSSNTLIRVASQDDSLYADRSGTPGVEYTYCVSVLDMAMTEGATRCDDGRRIIFPPTLFAATDATLERRVRLTWSDRSGVEAGYRILRDGGLLREVAANVDAFEDSSAAPGTVYSYDLIAFDAAGYTTAPLTDAGASAFIAAPLQVSASDGQDTTKVVITWLDATALEVNYRVYRSSGGPVELLATLPPGSTRYEDATATHGVTYEYCVAAVDDQDRESARACDSGGIDVLPMPGNVLATDGVFDDKVRVTWQDLSATEDGFFVYRMPAGTQDSVLVGNVGAGVTQFDDLGGEPGTAYDYCVAAYSNQGGRSGLVCDDGMRAVVLAPVSVQATDGTFEDRVDLVWESTSTSVVLFKIFRGGVFIRSVGGNRRAYSDDGVPSGVATAYSVTAVTALGVESPATTDLGSRAVAPPVSVKATDGEFEDRVAVTWTDRSAIESGYFVYRRPAGSAGPFARIASRPPNGTAYLDFGGLPGQAYEYAVAAFQAYGPGRADTTESDDGTDEGSRALETPAFVDAGDGAHEDQIVLTWADQSRYEEAYHVWRRHLTTNDSALVATLPPNSDRWVDLGIAFGAAYEYSVYAADSLGGQLLGRSPAGRDAGSTAILPPASVSASDLYTDRVVVAWIDQSALETAYEIRRDGVVIGTTAANVTSFTDGGLALSSQYTYCVRSISPQDSSDQVCDEGVTPVAGGADPTAAEAATKRITAGTEALRRDHFGMAVGGDGTRIIVGVPGSFAEPCDQAAPPYSSGNCYHNSQDSRAAVYVRQDSVYVVEQVFGRTSGYPGRIAMGGFQHDAVGGAVALYGNSGVVASTGKRSGPGGATGLCADAGTGHCGAYSFIERNPSTGVWSKTATVTNLPGTSSVDMNAQWAIVGGTGTRSESPGTGAPDGTGAGAAFRVYRRSGGAWVEAHTFNESSPASFRYFGSCVALSDSTAIVGAPTTNGVTPAVYVFRSNAAGTWSQTQSLTNPTGSLAFGRSVAIDGTRAVVGDPNSAAERVYVYERDASGTWQYVAQLQSDGAGVQQFGISVSIQGDSILVGAPSARSGEGQAYLFTLQESGWARRAVLSSDGNAPNCAICPTPSVNMGRSVRLMNGVLLAGADESRTGPVAGTPSEETGSVEIRMDPTIPGPATVAASDGTYRDKVQINWSDGFTTETGFRVYRDGSLVATTDPNIRNYVDFDAEPGRTHEYCISALLPSAGETGLRCDFGRRPPDGNITGRVSTVAAAGVSGTRIALDPAPNRAMLLDGTGGAMSVTDGNLFGDAFTVEFWYRGHASGAGATLLRHSTPFTADAFAVTNPANLTVTVNGTSQATGVVVNDGAWHHVAIARTRSGGALQVYMDGAPAFAGTLASGVAVDPVGPVTFGAALSGALDDIRVWSRVRTPAEVDSARLLILTGAERDLAAYWPLDAYQGVGAEEPVSNRYGRLAAGAHWIDASAPLTVFAVTDVQGNYVLPRLRYGASTTFKVTPAAEGHQFEPAFKTITLSTGNPVQNEVAFTDITSYTVSGLVRYPGLACAAANVPILVDGEVRGTTDGSGRYAVPVPPGDHTVAPRLDGHTFEPAAITLVNVAGDLSDQSFDETTVRRLQGVVGGGCNIPIGTLTLRIDSEDGCFSRTFDAETGYDEPLPPLKFIVRVIDVTAAPGGVDPVRVAEFFDNAGAREVDLTSANQVADFKYRAPMRVEIEGLPDVAPGCAITVPIVPQTERYPLVIRVFEDYGTSTCPVDTGTVTVFDEILDQEQNPVTLVIENGQAYVSTANGLQQYVTIGNKPNIYPGRVDAQGNDRSYQKALTVIAEVQGQRAVTQTAWAIVTGHKPRAATFTALSEGIPLFVLRDPPGDHSYSSLARETSFCTKISNITIGKASTGFQAKAVLGLNIEIGLFVMTRVLAQAFVQGGIEIGVQATGSNEIELCARTTEEFRTSAENLYIGRDGDLYVGMALNLLFAKTDVIQVEDCGVVASEDVTIGLDDVETVYSFTDWHIRNVIIPQLDDLAGLSPGDSVRFNSAKRNWEAHLALNDSLKNAATPMRNLSFSAGSEYDYSATVDTTSQRDWSVNVFAESNFGAGFDFEVMGSGSGFSYFSKFGISYERAQTTTTSGSRTTSYTLSDDDIGDFFSVNVKKDAFYGTPVFDILGGTSSCPWEPWLDPDNGQPRTQPVDGPSLTIQPPAQHNVPPDQPAVFTLSMTNETQADQLREYQVLAVQEENPGGAILRLDGDAFSTSGVSFFIEPGQTRQATLTVERGPSRYFYENLKVVIVPPCEYELFRNGGPLNLTNSVVFDVGFEAPCSDVTLFRPRPGWSVGAGTDSLELRLSDFELAISETDSLIALGAEYRRDGTDLWLPIGLEIPLSRLALGPDGRPASVGISWPVTFVPDGAYSIRAFTRCPNGKNYSGAASGVIDRSVPLVFGTPQPADGTLSLGEDISITFNEDMDCGSVNDTTAYLETTGGTPQRVPAQVTCNGRSLVIAATTDLSSYEGQTLQATVTGIRDRVGNLFGTRSWTFVVRQGEFAWAEASVSADVGYGAGGSLTVSLINGRNQQVQYSLSGLPAWLAAEPAPTELISARSATEVVFQVDPDTDLGSYDATIVATGNTVPPTTPFTATLDVHVDVLRTPPTWTVNPADYEHSMTIRAKVFVGADSLIDPTDVLAAFVGDQVRGVAHPQLVADGWRYFLTVYGKPPAYERIRFRVWDSRTSKTWIATDKTLRFTPDSALGAQGDPFEIRTRQPSPAIEQVIPVNAGWTWFSVNRRPTASADRTVAAVLSNLIATPGDLVKAQDGSIAMFDATAGWIGTLDTLGVTKSYRLKAAEAGEIRYESVRVLPSAYPIPVQQGWNWIGYTPDDARTVTSALAALASSPGDILRSQTAFAQYGAPWAGSLSQMAPGLGYVLYRSNAAAGQFLYSDLPVGPLVVAAPAPEAEGAGEARAPGVEGAAALPGWQVNHNAFQYDMVVTAELSGLTLGPNHQVAALVGDEIRGVARPVHVPALGRTLLFLMVRSNQTSGEAVRFQALDRVTGKVYEVAGTVAFAADAVLGATTAPVALASTGNVLMNIATPAEFALGTSQPNPLRGDGAAMVRYSVPRETAVTIEMFDIHGRRVRTLVNALQAPGFYDLAIESGDLAGGVYFYRMRAGTFAATRRLVVVR